MIRLFDQPCNKTSSYSKQFNLEARRSARRYVVSPFVGKLVSSDAARGHEGEDIYYDIMPEDPHPTISLPVVALEGLCSLYYVIYTLIAKSWRVRIHDC